MYVTAFKAIILLVCFYQGTLKENNKQELLENKVDPRITEILKHDDKLIETELTFPQDGSPPHYAFVARHYLDEGYPWHCVGRLGPI